MSAIAKAQILTGCSPALMPLNRRVARDFAALLGVALGSGLIAGLGMMLAVLLIS
jgi:hypothetical protein